MVGEKLPPLVIGKSANPKCLKSIKKVPLPYESNKNAWSTATIFEAWVKKLDSRMRKSNGTVALVLDNCTAHPNVIGLTNVKLIFLPPNIIAKTQPMDAGVIRCLKSHYQKKKTSKNAFIGIRREKELQDRRFRRNEASLQCLEFCLEIHKRKPVR